MVRALRPEFETARWYREHVRRFGYGYKALGFGRRSSQEKRFAAALALGSLHGRRVLDVGCGFGDFLAFLTARGVRPRYTGLDICPPMIERCRTRFRDMDARFVIGDALTYEPENSFDYVVASGIFGYAAKGTRERVQPVLEHLFSFTDIGLAVNFLSGCAPRRSPGRLYVYPWDILQLAMGMTPAVRLDHTYLPNDFTLCMYRTPPWAQP
ncbi:MAG: class I SAM-dependent methyltransferase [Betaproteobacteria bacterium]|nr:MAG: class I SAM-dependent methyltransferase [Betaproteobacteria bacterium]